ncbi:MAG: HDOD domain-containing protein [Gammaproteobacteria bacterium]
MPQDQMLIRVVLLLAAIVLLMLLVVASRYRSARRNRAASPRPEADPVSTGAPPPASAEPVPYADPGLELMTLELYRRAFGTTNFNYAALGEHQGVINAVRNGIADAVTQREYFPRKPLIVPRLLAAMRSNDSALKELVDIIMQDPVLTGDVLRTANSPFYRLGKEAVDTLGRAVVILGIEGLRSVIATSVMQPVFQVPKGYFENFSATVWALAQRSALCAQAYARTTRECDSFSAHLLSLLYHVSYIVLFRLTVAKYTIASGSLPRAEVFTRLIDEVAERLAGLIAVEWQLPEPMRAALTEHAERRDVSAMSPLARALYHGRLCGLGGMLVEDNLQSPEEVLALLERKGIPADKAAAIWELTQSTGAQGA